MGERPDGHDLLIIAREEFIKDLLPKLPNELRYQALMIANAMAIAVREFETGRKCDQRELLGLSQLLIGTKTDIEIEKIVAQTTARSAQPYRRTLATAIRAGDFDPGTLGHQTMLQHLKTTARDKLAISNPKLLSTAVK